MFCLLDCSDRSAKMRVRRGSAGRRSASSRLGVVAIVAATSLILSSCALSYVLDRNSARVPIGSNCPSLGAGADIDPDQFEIPATEAAVQPIADAMASLRCLPQAEAETQFIGRGEMKLVISEFEEPEDLELTEQTEPLVHLLGWIPPDADLKGTLDELSEGLVLGFYIPKANRMYVVSDSAELTPLDQTTFAHEWVHALQQKAFDIEAMQDSLDDFDFDGGGALISLVEGDASLFGDEFSDEFFSQAKRTEAAREETNMAGLSQADVLAVLPLIVDITMPYEYGPNFIESVFREGGDPPLAAIYARPPKTTAEILHPELYSSGFTPVSVSAPDLSAVLGSGWSQTMRGTWGEFSMANLIGSLSGSFASRELTVVDGWRGDVLEFWRNGPASAGAIKTTWDGPDSASAVRARLDTGFQRNGRAVGGGVYEYPNSRFYSISSSGSDTLFLMSSDLETAKALAAIGNVPTAPSA